jgi:hypothetical protein
MNAAPRRQSKGAAMTRLFPLVVVAVTACDVPRGENVVVTLPSSLGGGSTTLHAAPATPPTSVRPGMTGAPTNSSGPLVQVPDAAVPASMDLSAGAPAAGDQAATSSCQSWATGYTAMAWWANAIGVANARFAPMYLYAQIDGGACSAPLWAGPALDVLAAQGIDTAADYEPMQQTLDCATQPTAPQQTNAARFRISGHTSWDLSGGARPAIEAAIASGRPAIIGLELYTEFENATAQNAVVGPPAAGDTAYGGHVVVGFSYDDTGVWILNSWGTSWGASGWALLTWDYLEASFDGGPVVLYLDTIDGLAQSCSDDDASCAAWAAASQCQENPDYMLAHCCASCADPSLAYRTYAFRTSVAATCLDVHGDSSTDLTAIDEWTCNGTPAQQFTVLDGGSGAVQLYHPHSGKCVDVYLDGTMEGTPIDLYDCNGTPAQAFTAAGNADGTVTFTHRASGLCLDVTGASSVKGTAIQLWDCNGTAAQKWLPQAR